MPHILIAGKLHPAGLALLDRTPSLTYTHVEEVSEASYQPYLADADAMVIRTQPMSAGSIALATRMQIVSRHGVGYDAVDLSALNARQIPLCIVGDVNSVSVAEHAMMFILAAAKKLIQADSSVRNGPWEWRNKLQAVEISGRRLLIIGYGRIGRHLARMASGFNMEIRAYDPFLETKGWPAGNVKAAPDLNEALGWADVISVHAPKADRPLIGSAEIALMKREAILINTARGGVIEESALAAALAEGRIGAIGTDVFDEEPPCRTHPLLRLEQVVLTPHIAGLTIQAAERMAISSVQNIIDYFAGTLSPELIVNKDHLQ
ncbi:3-phosphoglycerate dehydrogenase (plasmid) [Rhizobium leguminosarum]|uniref:3-phosphoglycerate dehydrogenase n=1 Tax=Rhizobium leguminosarum TaxID=384 RepID=A0A1L3ZQ94_RHILE|nr:hydroxyacid dehydrogenase [Rhizobium leguminosarum]API57740.1 3-phosphoglycerate dehydrogenase [Rhizobium leguminosarum]